MPAQVTDIKEFLEIARRKDATSARIKPAKKSASVKTSKGSKGKDQIKFKIRAKRHLHTLILTDKVKVDKIKQSLPPALTVTEVGGKQKKAKKN